MNRRSILASQAVLAAPTPRLDVLTGLRWWAAFMVFLFHMRVFAPLPGPVTALFDQGYFGVTFFFVLSGFVLTWSARPGVSTSTFYWRRFARVWPAHIVALLFAIPVFYTFAPIPEGSFLKPFDLGILMLSVLLLQGWFANPVILFSGNPAAWTLTVEALFYAVHPWVSRLMMPLRVRGALILAAGAMVWAFGYRAALILLPDSPLGVLPMPITRLPEFLLGMALAWAMRCGWRPRLPSLVGVIAVGSVLCLIVAARPFPSLLPFALFGNELFTVAVGLAIVAFASASLRGRKSLFETAWQVRLGEWSFAFYLVHATVIYLALRVFGYQGESWSNMVWFAGIFAVDLLLAWMLHSFLERPLEKRMRRWKDLRDQRLSAPRSVRSSSR